MIGEIGGNVEELVVIYICEYVIKFVVVFIVGRFVLLGKQMGYVGVIIFGSFGFVIEKILVLEVVGIRVVGEFLEILDLLKGSF